MSFRIETDSMGEVKVPSDRLWGAQTQRSLENFRIGNDTLPEPLIRAYAIVKQAAAKGAPWEVMKALVEIRPYASLREAVDEGAYAVHTQAIVAASPVAQRLQELDLEQIEQNLH